MIVYWWNLLNAAVFDEVLPRPAIIKICTIPGAYADAGPFPPNKKETIDVILRINENLITTRKLFLTILVHEMVHQYQHVHEGRMTHGKTFFAWREIIEQQTGLMLAERYP